RRVHRDVDLIAQSLAQAAGLAEIIIASAPDFRIGIGAEIALAIDQDDRRAVHQQLLDQAARERRLARAGAAEHGRVPLQYVLVERDGLAAPADLAPGENARDVRAVFVENDTEWQILIFLDGHGRCRRRGATWRPACPVGETAL